MSITVQTGGHSQGISLYYKTVRSESEENIFVIHLKDGYCKSVLASDKLLHWAISYFFLKSILVVCLKSPNSLLSFCVQADLC